MVLIFIKNAVNVAICLLCTVKLLISEVCSTDHGLTETSNFMLRNLYIVVLKESSVIINTLTSYIYTYLHQHKGMSSVKAMTSVM